MGFDPDHCYFKKQPQSDDETNQAILAVWASCCGAVRYGGEDTDILRRLAELGDKDSCDHPPHGVDTVTRSHATFAAPGLELAGKAVVAALPGWNATSSSTHQSLSIHFTTDDPDFELRVQISQTDEENRWHLSMTPPHGPVIAIDQQLRREPGIEEIRWFTEGEWAGGAPGQEYPF